jgi:hypothetical protein
MPVVLYRIQAPIFLAFFCLFLLILQNFKKIKNEFLQQCKAHILTKNDSFERSAYFYPYFEMFLGISNGL